MADTTYIVFEKSPTGQTFKELGQVDAPTPKAAMERMAERISELNGDDEETSKTTYAATPFRNWTELPVGVEVVRRVKVG